MPIASYCRPKSGTGPRQGGTQASSVVSPRTEALSPSTGFLCRLALSSSQGSRLSVAGIGVDGDMNTCVWVLVSPTLSPFL